MAPLKRNTDPAEVADAAVFLASDLGRGVTGNILFVDAGMHVIYAGLWQTPEAVARAVADEDADWLGVSLLSGAHMTLVPRVLNALRELGRDDVRVMVGGIIPEGDIPKLLEMGVARVFTPGTSMQEIVDFLRQRSAASHA